MYTEREGSAPSGAAAAAIWLSLLRAVTSSLLALTVPALLLSAGMSSMPRTIPVLASKFTGNGIGTARALAQSVPKPAAPSAVAAGPNVTVTWPTTTMSGGTPAPGYVVKRYNLSNVAQTVLASCTGTITTTSCVEAGVPVGQWQYSVRAVASAWTSLESNKSSTVSVGAASLTFTSSTTITSLPAVLAGTIAGFSAGETLTFRLDSTTGTLLSGTPATVPSGGTGTISVTVPNGTNDAPHSVFALGSTGSVAAASINLIFPPVLLSLSMRDVNANGKIDRVLATFDDTLAAYTAGTAPWTLSNIPSGGSLQSVTVSGAVATLTITEGSGAADTTVGAFTVALAANSAGIRDIYDHTTTFATTAPVDAAAPALVSMTMKDANTNGKVDQVVAVFSETLSTYTAGNTGWTLANVPSAGSLASVAVATTTATLTLTEGAGAADTAVGAFTVALATNAAGVRDAAGNLSTFAATTLTDGAKPVRTGMDMLDVNRNGKIDSVTVTFSEALAATTDTGSWALTSVPSAGALATVSASSAVVTLGITEGTGAASTALGSFKVALTATVIGVRDTAGNQASFVATAPADKAAPAAIALLLKDNNKNGKIDRVTATFSETLSTYTAALAPWTLLNVPSGGTLASVTTSGVTATVVITEGAGAADTTTGSMTIALATNALGIRDAASNLSSFTARSLTDSAGPFATTITDTNGATDGKIEPGDTLVITFTEALDPATVPTSSTLTIADPLGTGNDTLNIAGVTSGNRTTGAGGYITVDGGSATFDVTIAMSNGNKTVTVTVGSTCTGTGCVGLGTVTTTPNLSWISATTIKDLFLNVSAGTKTQALRLF